MSEELNVRLGREVQKELCPECRETLGRKISRWDVLTAVTPRGLSRLARKVEEHVCPACREIVFVKAREVTR